MPSDSYDDTEDIASAASEPAEKAALFAALDGAPDRGLAEYEDYQTPAWVSAVAAAVDALQPLDPSRGDWMVDPAFSGSWLLAYTSPPTFRRNRGLSGYETFVDGVETHPLGPDGESSGSQGKRKMHRKKSSRVSMEMTNAVGTPV